MTAMKPPVHLRPVQESDAPALCALYAPYVLHTSITFEYEVPSEQEFIGRIRTHTADYPWLVCESEGELLGYAYGCRHRYRTAYQWSPESAIYLAAGAQGRGIGKALYQTLFDLLSLQGYFTVYGGVALPNEKSEALHRACGFEVIGDFKKVGYKLGQWHDVRWFQLALQEYVKEPAAPLNWEQAQALPEFHALMLRAHEKLNARQR